MVDDGGEPVERQRRSARGDRTLAEHAPRIWGGDPDRYRETYWDKFADKGYYFAGDGAAWTTTACGCSVASTTS